MDIESDTESLDKMIREPEFLQHACGVLMFIEIVLEVVLLIQRPYLSIWTLAEPKEHQLGTVAGF